MFYIIGLLALRDIVICYTA